jgi:hypothetical protein
MIKIMNDLNPIYKVTQNRVFRTRILYCNLKVGDTYVSGYI